VPGFPSTRVPVCCNGFRVAVQNDLARLHRLSIVEHEPRSSSSSSSSPRSSSSPCPFSLCPSYVVCTCTQPPQQQAHAPSPFSLVLKAGSYACPSFPPKHRAPATLDERGLFSFFYRPPAQAPAVSSLRPHSPAKTSRHRQQPQRNTTNKPWAAGTRPRPPTRPRPRP